MKRWILILIVAALFIGCAVLAVETANSKPQEEQQ